MTAGPRASASGERHIIARCDRSRRTRRSFAARFTRPGAGTARTMALTRIVNGSQQLLSWRRLTKKELATNAAEKNQTVVPMSCGIPADRLHISEIFALAARAHQHFQ